MAQGESETVPIEGVEGRGSCDPDSFVWRSISTCRPSEGGGGVVIFVFLEVVPHGFV